MKTDLEEEAVSAPAPVPAPTIVKERILSLYKGETREIEAGDIELVSIQVSGSNEHASAEPEGRKVKITGLEAGLCTLTLTAETKTQQVLVRVDDPLGIHIDEAGLLIGYTDQYSLIWNDKQSGATRNGSFWAPIPPTGYFSLGSYAEAGYGDPSGKAAMVCLKKLEGSDALSFPLDYERVYQDKGTGASLDLSVWLPKAPEGYAALGMVAKRGFSTKPSNQEVVCVKKKYLAQGLVGASFWDDRQSGGSQNFAGWNIEAPNNITEEGKALLPVAGAFISRHDHGYLNPPATHPCLWVLNVRLPLVSDSYDVWNEPHLSAPCPPLPTEPHIVQQLGIPMSLSKDPLLDLHTKVETSPMYLFQREYLYHWSGEGWDNTKGSVEQEQAWTAEKKYESSTAETFASNHGIEVGAELGAEGKIFSGKLSFKYSYQWSTTNTVSQTTSYTTTFSRKQVVPTGKYVGLWQVMVRYQCFRRSGSGEWESITPSPMEVPTMEVKTGEYPPS